MQFGFMSERGTIDAMFILRVIQEEYHAKENSFIFVLETNRNHLSEYQRMCWNLQLGKKGYKKFWLDQ